MTTSEEAVTAPCQHTTPCHDCPWRRDSLPGWLGGASVEEWTGAARGDEMIQCHVIRNQQCAGAAIFRKNIAKLPRDQDCLMLPADREKVFASPGQFTEHHSISK